jgi:hypothetical protein
LGLIVLAGLLAVVSARAEDAPTNCEVPDYLLATESKLPKVAEAIRSGHQLNILVLGSRSSTINAAEGTAYPSRLQVALKEKLPSVVVNVTVELQARKTADEVAKGLVSLLEGKRPNLVIWQTGTVDAMRAIDPDEFRSAVDEGVVALRNTMISVPPYLDNMRVVAQDHDIPLFDRFAIMRQWNDHGDFDLFSASPGVELAKRVHDCLGRALSTFVIGAAHLGTEQQN